jgi:uncharacterized membrane protein YkgB
MTQKLIAAADNAFLHLDRFVSAARIKAIGLAVALAGVVLPLALIGLLKFTQYEAEALQPLINGTPWLAWLYLVFGEVGTSALLGVVEILTAFLLIASIWSARAAILGGAIAALTFATTVSIMLVFPIWEASIGGFPWLNAAGQFLLKDVALLGFSLVILGDGLARLRAGQLR